MKNPLKNETAQNTPKNLDFRGFPGVQNGWKPTILKLKSASQLQEVDFWGFLKSF